MEEIEEFTDERQKGWCIHCGTSISTVSKNWDHVPTKGLLLLVVLESGEPLPQTSGTCKKINYGNWQ